MVKFETVKIEKTAEVNIILGQAHLSRRSKICMKPW
jgi:adenosine/AMP kinase